MERANIDLVRMSIDFDSEFEKYKKQREEEIDKIQPMNFNSYAYIPIHEVVSKRAEVVLAQILDVNNPDRIKEALEVLDLYNQNDKALGGIERNIAYEFNGTDLDGYPKYKTSTLFTTAVNIIAEYVREGLQ